MLRRPKGSQKQSMTASPMVEPQTVAACHVHHKAPAPVADAAGIAIDVTSNAEASCTSFGHA
jgi:hypothetical protein